MSHYAKEDIKAHVLISQYLDDQGVKRCGARAVATWRGGKNYNVAINDGNGTWRDFKANEGGDIFTLFEKIEGGDFATAVKTLGERYWIPQSEDGASPSSWRRPSRPSAPVLTKREREEARRRILPVKARDFVPVTLRACGGPSPDGASIARAFRWTCLEADCPEDLARLEAARQLRALFRPSDLIWAGWIVKDEAVRDRLGLPYTKTPLPTWPSLFREDRDAYLLGARGVYNAHALAAAIEAGLVEKVPPSVSLNPVTGKADENGSYDSCATIAAYRHALVEWDSLFDIGRDGVKTPSLAHFEIAAGLVDVASRRPDRWRVASTTYTGGKSIHVALRVKAETQEDYEEQTGKLRDLFTSADDPAFRVDPSGWDNAYTHIRLAGAVRPETGRRARLLMADIPDDAF